MYGTLVVIPKVYFIPGPLNNQTLSPLDHMIFKTGLQKSQRSIDWATCRTTCSDGRNFATCWETCQGTCRPNRDLQHVYLHVEQTSLSFFLIQELTSFDRIYNKHIDLIVWTRRFFRKSEEEAEERERERANLEALHFIDSIYIGKLCPIYILEQRTKTETNSPN